MIERGPRPRSQRNRTTGKVICFDCELTKGEVNCLPGAGPRTASIMIVGESPTRSDAHRFEPFRGREGQKLAYLLDRAGLDRDDCFLTYSVKCPIGGSKKPKKKHLSACKTHLIEELRWVRPKVVLLVGSAAFSIVAGTAAGSPSDWRGFPIPIKSPTGKFLAWGLPVMSMGMTLKHPELDPVMIRDLKLAKKLAAGYEPKAQKQDVELLTTVEGVERLVDLLENSTDWAFDLETTGLDFVNDKILCASFSAGDRKAFVVPIDHWWPEDVPFGAPVQMRWSEEDRETVLSLLRRAFASAAEKSAQNGKFDLKFLRTYGIPVRNFRFDTMLAHHLVDGSKPHDLTFIAQWYGLIEERFDALLEVELAKTGRKYGLVPPMTLYQYAGVDALLTYELKPILRAELERTRTEKVFDRISMPLTILLAEMEYGGVHIDREAAEKLAAETAVDLKESLENLRKLTKNPKFNPNSPKQVLDYLKARGVRLSKLTSGGGYSTDEEVISALCYRKRVGDFAKSLLRVREIVKIKGTYLDGKDGKGGLIGRLDSRSYLHTDFKVHGTYTGRLSSAEPNLQNIPKDARIRGLFIPDAPGDEFMSVDYKQLEVRVAAAIAKDEVMIREIREGVDMHSRNAATFLLKMDEKEFRRIYKIADEGKKDDPEFPLGLQYAAKRGSAKAVTFGVLYGSSAHGVAIRNDIPVEECELFINKFFRKYAGIRDFVHSQHDLLRTTGRVYTETRRFYRFYELDFVRSRFCSDKDRRRIMGDLERVSVNMPIQGFGSDIYQTRKLALRRFLKENKLRSRLVLSIHDGFVMNVKPDEKDFLEKEVKKIMRTTLNTGTRYEVEVDVDVKFMPKWGV